ncbi:MAG TPA: hypothetical protein VN737_05455 [Bryobacteraceae bacterium]|nr:hypothetical protein [Bryobacteraceae bacterium]
MTAWIFALLALLQPLHSLLAKEAACVATTHGCIAINPDVTPATIKETMCLRGYTKQVRPAVVYTNGVKKLLMKRQGIDLSHIHEYELDHIIPLELGGHPRSLTNLQLQPWEGDTGAKAKDKLETRLHNAVCRGKLPLTEAQRCIAENWVRCAAQHPGRRQH